MCEIYEMDVDSKYQRVLRAVENLSKQQRDVPNLRYERLSLDVAKLRSLKARHHIPDVGPDELKAWRSSAGMKEILATAGSVFSDVVSRKITLTGDDGECDNVM